MSRRFATHVAETGQRNGQNIYYRLQAEMPTAQVKFDIFLPPAAAAFTYRRHLGNESY